MFLGLTRWCGGAGVWWARGMGCKLGVFFIFVFLKKIQKYIFGFRFYSFIPYRLAGGRQEPICK